MTSTVVVIGGGISGLAGAHALCRSGHQVILLEAGDRLGGKLLTSPFAGRPVDEGADAFLSRLPHALDLCQALGLAGDLVSPATSQAALWLGGRLRAIPTGSVLGVPVELRGLARSRVLSTPGLVRAAVEPWLPGAPVVQDVSVGRLVRRRYGREVHERLVDPLLGSINAGRTEDLSLDVGAPPLAAAARRSASLTRGLRAERSGPGRPAPPRFYAPREGMGSLVEALAKALFDQGADVRLSTRVRAIEPTRRGPAGAAGGSYQIVTAEGEAVAADGVLLAVPAHAAASVVHALSEGAARGLAAVEYASVAVVTLAYPATAVSRPLTGSGFLVPRSPSRLLTACSFFSNKWPPAQADGNVVLRASVGRMGEERSLDLDDAALVERVHAELVEALALRDPPAATRVSRWPSSFPQFPVGHLARMDQVQVALGSDAPGVALAGAYLRGVGLPTCIAGASEAAARLDPPGPG